MFLKSLFVLAIVVLSNSAAVLRVGDDNTYRIRSEQYGYVHHYGIYDNLDLLEFSTTLPPAHFRFTNENVLQEIITGKCVNRKTDGNQQLILTDICDGDILDEWVYHSTAKLLQDITTPGKGCFSPWNYSGRPPPDLNITTGVSPCDTWNQIILEADPNHGLKPKKN